MDSCLVGEKELFLFEGRLDSREVGKMGPLHFEDMPLIGRAYKSMGLEKG